MRTDLLLKACRPTLRRAFLRGRHDHGALRLSYEAYAARVLNLALQRLARVGRTADLDSVRATLDRTACDDLHLTTGCELGHEDAWAVLISRRLPPLGRYLIHRGASPAQAAAVLRELPGRLLAPPARGGAATTVGTYDGRGSLRCWLDVVAYRAWAASLRLRRRRMMPLPEGVERVLPGPEDSQPLPRLMDREARRLASTAVGAAWRQLPARTVAALELRYRDGLLQKDIARLFHVSEGHMSKILSRGVDVLRRELATRDILMLLRATPGQPLRTLRTALEQCLATSGAASHYQ